MIEALGYKMGSDGYYAKDGKTLTMDISTHNAFIEKQRIADVLVEQFQKVGIKASRHDEAAATWDDNRNRGNFDTQMNWHNCDSVNEPWASMYTLSIKNYKPVGQLATTNGAHWQNQEYSDLVDQIGVLPLGDPRIDPLFIKAMDIYYRELPTIPITQARKLIPFNTTYWTNWPTAKNNYASAWTWWQSFYEILTAVKPAGG
jgi:peptide/nickel transport system substrate-binding protein